LIIDFKTEVINNDFIIKFATLFSNLPINIFIQLLEIFYNFIINIKNRTNELENELYIRKNFIVISFWKNILLFIVQKQMKMENVLFLFLLKKSIGFEEV
jgi:hypothetical protein